MNRAERRRREKQAQKAARAKGQTTPSSVVSNAPPPDHQAALKSALASHQGGRLDDAEKQYRALLLKAPEDPIVLNLLGVLQTQKQDYTAALELHLKAVKANPEFAEGHCNLGSTYKTLGRFDDAQACFQTALKLKPDYANAQFNMGTLLLEQRRNQESLPYLEKAIALKPDFIEALNNLGNALYRLDRLEDAEKVYLRILEISPGDTKTRGNLGNVYQNLNRLDEALRCFQDVLKVDWNNAVAHNNIANTLRILGHFDTAITHAQEALKIDPNLAGAYNCLGGTYQELGRFEDAKENYRKAIALDPHFAVSYRHLAGIEKHTEYDAEIKAMERVFQSGELNSENKMHLAFALGKAFEDLRDTDQAFEYYRQGNELKHAAMPYDAARARAFTNDIKDVFTAEFTARHKAAAHADETPIFIIGMPRSGTSLAEQILASHPRVFGAGELDTLSQLASASATQHAYGDMPSYMRKISDEALRAVGRIYLAMLRKLNTDATYITDKMPENYLNVGIIKTVFPGAKIIHCKRNPADNGLSLFKNYFSSRGHQYAYDLATIGHHYNLYADLMDHWEREFPGFAHEIRYEDMIADPEDNIRALLDHCGLEWDDACLNFSKTKRAVKTASAAQVRQPIYKTSVQAWRKFETQLQPMIDAFSPSVRRKIG